MRRLLQFVLLVIFVTASTTGLRASTDCERWFIAYKQQLEHTKSLQRIEAARRRAHMYAKRKLAGYTKPKAPAHPRPHRKPMGREETLRHFNLACGVLPEESADQPLIAEEKPAPFVPVEPEDFLAPDDGGTEIASYVAPPYVPPNFGPPSEGGPPLYYPPYGGGGGVPTPRTPGNPPPTNPPPTNPPPTNPPPTNPPPVVPEPGSLTLVLTGAIAAAGVLRRKFKSIS